MPENVPDMMFMIAESVENNANHRLSLRAISAFLGASFFTLFCPILSLHLSFLVSSFPCFPLSFSSPLFFALLFTPLLCPPLHPSSLPSSSPLFFALLFTSFLCPPLHHSSLPSSSPLSFALLFTSFSTSPLNIFFLAFTSSALPSFPHCFLFSLFFSHLLFLLTFYPSFTSPFLLLLKSLSSTSLNGLNFLLLIHFKFSTFLI
ncbi:unnamed protein product [Acanthosepion pharaonis]|uniref:Uncharacterized protein n=1 Tax=Acanthosepion pharaonis TaxID=158019 RepID=A0A812CS56_ACAPH|nr:unnamed protein product [Sepia pharaonis]